MELWRLYVVLETPVQKKYGWKMSFVVLMIDYIDVADVGHFAKKIRVYINNVYKIIKHCLSNNIHFTITMFQCNSPDYAEKLD